jgi:hypothetical protein
MQKIFPAISLSLSAGLITGHAVAADAVREYVATYEVRYKGKRVAESEFRVTAEEAGGYSFTSSTRARGILRLATPNAAVEHSVFELTDGRIQPIHFDSTDGSRKGEDNYSIDFDPSGGEIRIMGAGGTSAIPFEPGVLDLGSLQVALMHDVAHCTAPGTYRFVDDNGIDSYTYTRIDDQAAETDAGTFPTYRYSQQREGSSRQTVIWLAPELSALPVRIEQFRNGELQTVFSLAQVSGLQRGAPGCSGLR